MWNFRLLQILRKLRLEGSFTNKWLYNMLQHLVLMKLNTIHNTNCLDGMKKIEDDSIDAIVTDPPYGLSFMGKKWDYDVPEIKIWQECLRVLKPGGMLLSFAGTRTQHRIACAIEDAGFEIRDTIAWVYSTGFPKSLNIKKQLHKRFKNECGFIDVYEQNGNTERTKEISKYYLRPMSQTNISQEINIEAKQREILQSELQKQSISLSRETPNNDRCKKSGVERWSYIKTSERELQRCKICSLSKRIVIDGEEGWLCYGTPFGYGTRDWETSEKNRSCSSYRPQSIKQQKKQFDVVPEQFSTQKTRSFEQAFLGWGTALKPAFEPITVARKPLSEKTVAENVLKWGTGGINVDGCRVKHNEPKVEAKRKGRATAKVLTDKTCGFDNTKNKLASASQKGRFPANFIHDGSKEVLKGFPQQKRGAMTKKYNYTDSGFSLGKATGQTKQIHNSNSGSASRFFYCAKASKSERNYGCEEMPLKHYLKDNKMGGEKDTMLTGSGNPRDCRKHNNHPTVKPLKLMEYLIKLVSKKNAIILDPFMGSGTTAVACINLQRQFIGFELEEDYCKIANARINKAKEQTKLGDIFGK